VSLAGRAEFAGSGATCRFVLRHEPLGPPRALVLHAHAWAEEMNKARRMTAYQARSWASEGVAVARPDLLGCGDSPGEFADAAWDTWIDDLVRFARELQSRYPGVPLWLWGLRAGALLARAAVEQLEGVAGLVLWQPATQGRQVLRQFLRLRSAAAARGLGTTAAMPEQLLRELESGHPVELAGYVLPPALALGLRAATLAPSARPLVVHWIEVSARPDATLLPASAACIQSWETAGHTVRPLVVPGPAFWQTQEIEDAPALVAASTAALR
jgi:exosortase A-associated hydrolase 2